MRTLSRSAVCLSAVLVLSACTGDDRSTPSPTGSTTGSGTGVVTNSEDVTYVPGRFEYRFNDVAATFAMDAGGGTLTVKNASGAGLGEPGMYVLGIDDTRYEGTVTSPAAIEDGSDATFQVTFPEKVTPATIGLIVLLFGGSDYGAMAPTPAA